MKANATPVVALFEKKMRLEVPLFQRQYVWSAEHQWEPLWEDIQRKFIEYLDGRSDAPVHFLGAIVLDQKQTPSTHVERRMVIDGQQRLTTLQIFLVAFRDYCLAAGADALAAECENFTINKGMMPDPAVDKFKVWPTQQDRASFRDVVEAGTPTELLRRYPTVWRKYARKPDAKPRIVDCYLYFHQELADFFEGANGEAALSAEIAVAERLELCFQALRNSLLVVAIDLEAGDDAQVIFETLNARGEPLLPADLLRNYIFLRAARNGESAEELYPAYWARFDEPFWREIVSQGRINRPRSDLFMQHYLASKQGVDIPIKHLYVEYRHWVEKIAPFASVRDELVSLSDTREKFGQLLRADEGFPFSRIGRLLNAFDIGTAYPLILFVESSDVRADVREEIYAHLESYIVRRAICGLTNKNYNRVFLSLIRLLKRDGVSASNVEGYLRDLRGDSAEWPSDERFMASWASAPIYEQFSNARTSFVLLSIDERYRGPRNENIEIRGPLTVEHIMPQSWIENWPLSDGSIGMTWSEIWDADEADPRARATRERNTFLHTMGNLTILSQALNSSVSNSAWDDKKPELLRFSLLPINQELHDKKAWNEETIVERGKKLFVHAKALWPR